MRNKILKHTFFATILSVGCASSAFANPGDIAVGVKGGTLGLGGEVTVEITPALNARAGYNGYNYNGSTSKNLINYDYKLSLGSFPVLLDWYPFENSGFRLSPGVIFNNNKLSVTGTSSQALSYTIGGTTYTSAQIGSLTGTIDLNKTVPYVGFGWGNAVGKDSRLSFIFDLGVMFQGTPKVALNASNLQNNLPGVQSTIQSSIDKEIADLKDTTDHLKYYPVVSIGLAYKF